MTQQNVCAYQCCQLRIFGNFSHYVHLKEKINYLRIFFSFEIFFFKRSDDEKLTNQKIANLRIEFP